MSCHADVVGVVLLVVFLLEIKYALIGGGIGLFFALVFILIKIWIIRKQVLENSIGEMMDAKSCDTFHEHAHTWLFT